MMSSLVCKPSITLPLSWAVWCAGDASVLVLVLVVGAAASLTISISRLCGGGEGGGGVCTLTLHGNAAVAKLTLWEHCFIKVMMYKLETC